MTDTLQASTGESTESPPPTPRQRSAARMADAAAGPLRWLVLKIALLAIVDAVAVYAVFVLFLHSEWLVLAGVVAVTILVNWIYFSRRHIPAKYLTPGIILLVVFQIFTLVYTGYIGFTNYGTGHNGSKDQAIASLMRSSLVRVEDSPTYDVAVVERFGELGLLVTDPTDGEASLGTNTQPLQPIDATMEDGKAVAVDDWTTLAFSDVLARSSDVEQLAVPASDDPNDGAIRTQDGQKGYLYTSTLVYDEAAGTMTDTATGVVYTDDGEGAFTSPEGEQLLPGWQVFVGFDNFVRAVTDASIRGPLLAVTAWTFVFAAISVASTFFLGLLLALVFQHKRMRFKNGYRILLILPYAFPAFLSALIWAGMMNESFGFINQVLLGGASVPWLTDPWLAKASVLIVNLWLGFPYMFLVCMGALQGIPEEVNEAAVVDGANPWQIFRRIKLPLLLVTVTPLLIASFAFNFNNFNLIYMLTGGGPRFTDVSLPVGHTDILISMVYKVAFTGQNRDYGLASAFTILIFIVVAAISIISFRKTKALEELN
ncbi:arabinogalactan oligomer/maltooligosaccharide transport system permease protein [Microbacterium terrae]|uniref:Maltose/maltodextrin transport system permease protein n=2 Tax=Microbacterium terrae TaxID=69369 RepID=A0A0M2H0D7_9MICO|nr:ABC transporter permease subunit [Microbacterium terrae]KJL37480.1 Maltose transport system permease protein MalF [Microbacterium terrae]MBP1076309.1 arabinogalactan oligomer/maltooligosaccharide transport system permease protein [Microbacterium terrae]GLJ97131.1 sugar ABC transporter permease [Microbacterium terrae]